MRTIGRTNEGKYIVEMEYEEMATFDRLKDAADGKVFHFEFREPAPDFGDMQKVFAAIRTWMISTNTVNEMEGAVDRLRYVLGMEKVSSGTCSCSGENEACSNCTKSDSGENDA